MSQIYSRRGFLNALGASLGVIVLGTVFSKKAFSSLCSMYGNPYGNYDYYGSYGAYSSYGHYGSYDAYGSYGHHGSYGDIYGDSDYYGYYGYGMYRGRRVQFGWLCDDDGRNCELLPLSEIQEILKRP